MKKKINNFDMNRFSPNPFFLILSLMAFSIFVFITDRDLEILIGAAAFLSMRWSFGFGYYDLNKSRMLLK